MLFALLALILSFTSSVTALGTSCSVPLGAGTAAPGEPFWLQTIKHQGTAAFNPNPAGYQVFRNVKDFGARGDGVTDDTAAINNAISSGGRCGGGSCHSSTVTPALVYFPAGTYLVTSPIVPYYYTQLIGDARNLPTLLAAANFVGMAIIDADPYIPGGNGIWMENGSGGYMGDMVFNGGKFGMWVGNQQFTVRNVTMNNADTGWTFQGVTINNCQVGFDLSTGGVTQETQTVGAEAIIDAVVTNTPIFVRTSQPSNGRLGGSLVLNNIRLNNVPVAVGVAGGATVLNGGTTTITSWGQGNVYSGVNGNGAFTQGNIPTPNKPAALLDSSGKIFGKTHPQYAAYSLSQIVSVKDHGARGDGSTDDTAALQAIFNQFSGCKIIFFDAGTYIVTSTLTIPAGTQMTGEAWTVIAGKGATFNNINSPVPVVRVGEANSQGLTEISDIVFSTVGPAPGAIVVEWNVKQPANQQGGAGMWDSHIRLGGAEHHVLYQYNLVNAQNHYMGLIQTETPYYQPAPAAPAPFTSNTAFHDPTFTSSITSAWGLRIQSSSNIIVFGAGLYSFFQNYVQTCLDSFNCQNQMANVDASSNIFIYSLSTVASTFQLSVSQNGVVNQGANRDGFASTVTSWSS
ncbi:hypothetical protein EYR40_001332 [Pleurotus pulmonarius]|nr:hypothetical protein EYR38_004571 [Pleurotus pulmonarius]KAF4608979.1 hypothetical protein EYR40_001332 [Pleurotus pulmonarius]